MYSVHIHIMYIYIFEYIHIISHIYLRGFQLIQNYRTYTISNTGIVSRTSDQYIQI